MIRTKTNRKRADAHERRVAGRLGGRVTRGSGSSVEKGDVKAPGRLRVECKTTAAETWRLDPVIMEKIRTEAAMAGETGILNVQFEKTGRRYVIMAEDDFEERCALHESVS